MTDGRMNERIVDLYEQASLFASEEENLTKSYKDRVMVKFAELIVRECAEMVRIQNEQFMENESHYGVVSTDVLKHFGFEG